MVLHPGTQDRIVSEVTIGAGTTSKEGSTQTDSILVSLYVNSISSGTLTLTVYTLTDTGKEEEIISFPAVSAATANLLLRKAAVTLQRFRVVAVYTGVVDYEVYVRALSGSGESSARILGSTNWDTSQVTVGTTAIELIPSALTDRSGLVIKNWSAVAVVYLAPTAVKATVAGGYPLAPRDALALDIAAGASVWAISDIPAADIRIGQAGG